MNMNIKIFECSYHQSLKLKGLDETIWKYAETSLLDLVHEKLKDKEQFVDDILIKYGELALREETHFIFATNEQDEVVGLCVYGKKIYKDWDSHFDKLAYCKYIYIVQQKQRP